MPKLLDLFCCAGGAAVGYHRAGFDVVGVDINPQPNYPFEFHQADALEFPLEGYDVIHASPPCQRYTSGAKQAGTANRFPDLIAATRGRISQQRESLYVIENVMNARADLLDPVRLCGTTFGLGVQRHRLFESSVQLTEPPHLKHYRGIGDTYETVAGHPGGSGSRDGWVSGGVAAWAASMGIWWMTGRELAEAIPPAYTEYIGRQLRNFL